MLEKRNKITTGILLLSAFVFSNTSWASNWNQSKVVFSKYFYGNSAGKKECLRGPLPPHSFSLKPEEESIRLIASVIGFDWENEHRKNSSSLSVKHEKISFPVRELFAISQQAVATKNEKLKKDVKKQHKQKISGWKELLHFWPLSIIVPLMLISIILGPLFQ